MNFQEIQQRAAQEWQELENSRKTKIIVGYATCGQAAGATAVLNAIKEELAKNNLDCIIHLVGCIGCCYAEPLVDIAKPNKPRISYGNMTPERVRELVRDYIIADNPRADLAMGTIGEGTIEGIPKLFETPYFKPQLRMVSHRCGFIDAEYINQYIATGGYSALNKALKMKPEEIIEELKKSGLKGRGGAGFPTWRKWEEAKGSKREPKYIVCNADEGDPGAFMNRSLLESDPHAILEGMAIAGLAVGSHNGYIYARAEYPLAVKRLYLAIEQAEKMGLLGDNILGSGFDFKIRLNQGAGAFVCGEGSALMYSIEGKRGMPRVRPPRSVESGLWGLPTVLNNVESLAHVSNILNKGGEWFAGYGTEDSKGTKTFSLTGKVIRTGMIEVPLGITLRTVIYDIGGGILADKPFKAIQTGGPSGGCLPADLLDLPVDFERLAKAGSIMGSGGMVVLDNGNCMVNVASYFVDFCRDESCGKCVPCREGMLHMSEVLHNICEGKGVPGDIEKLSALAETVGSGSLCGLGKTAPNPVLSTIRYFRDEYEAHIREKRCPALSCKTLITFYILPDKCQGCGICLRQCPAEAITGGKRMVHIINQEKCVKCGTCLEVCPQRFDAVTKVSGKTIEVPKEPIPVLAGKK